jgi:hypothetical protein
LAQPKSTGKRPRTRRLSELFAEEERRGVTRPEIYRDFFKAIEQRKRVVLDYLDKAIAKGKTVAGFGASTTTTTLIYHFELGSRIRFLVDDNPLKQNTVSPGLHIPVLSSSELYAQRPDIVVVLPWIHVDKIVDRHRRFAAEGGQFLIPLPEMRLVAAPSSSPSTAKPKLSAADIDALDR